MKAISLILLVSVLFSCAKKEEGFLDRDLTDSERQYILSRKKDKCLAEASVKKDFETVSTESINSFSELAQILATYTTNENSLVYLNTEESNLNVSKTSTVYKTEFYLLGFDMLKTRFYYLSVKENGDVDSHGFYGVTENGEDLIDLKNSYCTYKSATHTLNTSFVLSFGTTKETNPSADIKNTITSSYSVNAELPLMFSADATQETDVTVDSRGSTNKVTTKTNKSNFAQVGGRYDKLSKAAKPFCEYLKSEFSEDLGDCSVVSYTTVRDALITQISAK
jgi:hypothetical protein